jgi:hypothetical protein
MNFGLTSGIDYGDRDAFEPPNSMPIFEYLRVGLSELMLFVLV